MSRDAHALLYIRSLRQYSKAAGRSQPACTTAKSASLDGESTVRKQAMDGIRIDRHLHRRKQERSA